MSRIAITALLALSALAVPAAAFAQAAPTTSEGSAVERGRNVSQCQAPAGGSRMRNRNRGGCEQLEETTAVQTEQEVVSIELTQPDGPRCEATTLTEYSQRNNVARVTGTISIANCPAGTAGVYNVVARVRDESGEIKPIEFSESWQTDAPREVSFNADYPIGENVELVSVRVRDLKCTCAEGPEAAPAAASPPN